MNSIIEFLFNIKMNFLTWLGAILLVIPFIIIGMRALIKKEIRNKLNFKIILPLIVIATIVLSFDIASTIYCFNLVPVDAETNFLIRVLVGNFGNIIFLPMSIIYFIIVSMLIISTYYISFIGLRSKHDKAITIFYITFWLVLLIVIWGYCPYSNFKYC